MNRDSRGRPDHTEQRGFSPPADYNTRVLLLVVAAGLVLPWRADGQASRPSPEALARALQQRYDRIKDFTADFVQTYRGGVLRTQTQERGRVVIKKPSRMHWTYLVPEKKEFVSDGVKVYSFIPQDRQVIISSVPADAQATTPALFLAGKGNIVQTPFPRRRRRCVLRPRMPRVTPKWRR